MVINMKKANLFVCTLLTVYLLSGCIPPSVDSSRNPNIGTSSSQEPYDVAGPDGSSPPVGSAGDASLNAVESLWFFDLLGQSAGEVARRQNSPITSWECETNMDGYDPYFDASYDITYLFTHKVEDISEADVCEGIIAPIENCLYIRSQNSDDILTEISEDFFAEFEWSSREGNYYYVAYVETRLFPVEIVIYTDPNKEFNCSTIIQFTVPTNHVYRRSAED